jgi:hypothetical protein
MQYADQQLHLAAASLAAACTIALRTASSRQVDSLYDKAVMFFVLLLCIPCCYTTLLHTVRMQREPQVCGTMFCCSTACSAQHTVLLLTSC